MAKIPMSLEEEMKVTSEYGHIGTWYGAPYANIERLNPPIPVGENLARYIKGEDFEWVPDPTTDFIDFTPECIPDVVAQGFGGGLDAFKVKWIPDESAPDLPAFVEPGFILLDDICDWNDLEFPDVDSWDWEENGMQYREFYKDDDRLKRGILLSGFFERLISVMGFEGAALAMLEEPDEVRALFEALADINIEIINHYIDDFGCAAVMLHDDWAAQKAPFFSPDLTMEIVMPALKRVVDHAHSRGILFTMHSCGNGLGHIPAMKAAGVDGWQAQFGAFDMDEALKEIDNAFVLETYPFVPEGIQGEEFEQFFRDCLSCTKQYKFLFLFYEYDPVRALEGRKMLYKIGRELAVSGEAV